MRDPNPSPRDGVEPPTLGPLYSMHVCECSEKWISIHSEILSFKNKRPPLNKRLSSNMTPSTKKSSARCETPDGRLLARRSGIDLQLPTLIPSDPPSKPSSSEKASLYISGLEVLLNIRHSNQTQIFPAWPGINERTPMGPWTSRNIHQVDKK